MPGHDRRTLQDPAAVHGLGILGASPGEADRGNCHTGATHGTGEGEWAQLRSSDERFPRGDSFVGTGRLGRANVLVVCR